MAVATPSADSTVLDVPSMFFQSGGCGGERTFAVSDLDSFYRGQTLGRVLQRMRCSGCGGRVGAAWLVTGPGARRPGQGAPGAPARAGGEGVVAGAFRPIRSIPVRSGPLDASRPAANAV